MATVIRRRQQATKDSFTNFAYKLGKGAGNPLDSATYSLNNLLSRERIILEAAYRSSWLVGQTVDAVAEDMTKMGIEMLTEMSPGDIKKLQAGLTKYNIWGALCDLIKWARLYGGAIGIILIDGARYDTPFDVEKVGKNSFKGILVLDRWMCEPVLEDLINDWNTDFGKPKYYRIHTSVSKFSNLKIHHSRVIKFDGITLPYYQKIYENHWGISVIERIYDRLVSYDSATLGASQLMYKCYLRIISIDGLREKLALGGAEEAAIITQFNLIRKMQGIEGITLLDKNDDFKTVDYSFSGIADVLRELGQQISGATGIPLVRLFGQSPSGFSTGDADLRNYYDNIHREQENKLRQHIFKILKVMSLSILGQELPEDFEFKFVSLWQMSDREKAEIANSDMNWIGNAFGSGIISKEKALKELKQSSQVTGRGTNITAEDLKKAKEDDENQPPAGMPLAGMLPAGMPLSQEGAGEDNNEEQNTPQENTENEDSAKSINPGISATINVPVAPLTRMVKPAKKRISERWRQALQNISKMFFT